MDYFNYPTEQVGTMNTTSALNLGGGSGSGHSQQSWSF